MEFKKLAHKIKASGMINLPGSKSIANRVLLLSSLAEGSTVIENLPLNDDVNIMFNALKQLGLKIEGDLRDSQIIIEGCAGALPSGEFSLFLENAGTAYRPLTAALCLGQGNYFLDCIERMKERPIKDLVDALQKLGAQIDYLENDGCPPIKIRAQGQIDGGKTSVKGDISSQYLTALLMVAPYFKNDTIIQIEGELTSKPYISMTLKLMKQFAIDVKNHNWQLFEIKGQQIYKSPHRCFVEPDASSASYFLAAAAIHGKMTIPGISKNSIQGEAGFADVLSLMGANVQWNHNSVSVENEELHGIDIDMNTMTDTGMTLAVLALFAKGTTVIRNIANWQVKESPRITAVACELRKLGAIVEEGRDYLKINPPDKIQSAHIATYNDHRMAMAFSLAAFSDAEVIIENPSCTSKTFPDFFDYWDKYL